MAGQKRHKASPMMMGGRQVDLASPLTIHTAFSQPHDSHTPCRRHPHGVMTQLPGLVFGPDLDEDPKSVLQALNTYRAALAPPYQSLFRVIAVVVYEDGQGRIGHVVGANAEPCMIAGSICAERAALVSLRHVPQPVTLLRVYVSTDNADPLFPGVLCKEFLSSMADDKLSIVVSGAQTTEIRERTLGELWPYASLYRHADRPRLVNVGEAFVQAFGLAPPPAGPEAILYDEVVKATARYVERKMEIRRK